MARAGNGWQWVAMGKKGTKLYIIYYILYIKSYLSLTLPFALFSRLWRVSCFDFAYILVSAKIPHILPLPKILGYLDKSLQVIDLYKKKAILAQKTVRIALHTF